MKPPVSSKDADLEELLRLAADSLPTGVLVARPDGVIALVNWRLGMLFGYSQDELIGQPAEILLPHVLSDQLQGLRPQVTSVPQSLRMEAKRAVHARRRDGSAFQVEIGVTPIRTNQGTYVLATVVDPMARRDLEEAHSQVVEGRFDFERLVAELSVRFINLPAEDVDEAIRHSLGRVGEALGLDRCTFYHIAGDGQLTNVVGWQAPGVPPTPSWVSATNQFPWALKKARAGETICFASRDEIPDPVDRESFAAFGTTSTITVPLQVGGRTVGAVGFNMVREQRHWLPTDVHRLHVIASTFSSVLARRESEAALRKALAEIERLRDQLQAENAYLRREVQQRQGTGIVVGPSASIRSALEQIRQVAPTDSTVLLLGETGTGKELLATQIHELSARRGRPMVRVNCSAIPATLIESELFGREKGAFTGALARQIGRFELADRSTIFLDEIGELALDVQNKLLRVLEERQIERLGSPAGIHVDTRIIAATHRDLEQRIAEGTFREDLFYRLNVFPIHIPPLRERLEDVPLLVWRFVEEFSKALGKPIDAISQESMAALQQYSWPGNIRELRNVVERAMIVARGPRLSIPLPTAGSRASSRSLKLTDVERDHIRGVLESTGWRVRGTGGAADRLGLRPTTLETRLAKLGLKRPKQR